MCCLYFFFKLKKLKIWQIFLICNFNFVLFWLGTEYELVNNMGLGSNMNKSIVWVIIGLTSECRRSSCSTSFMFTTSLVTIYDCIWGRNMPWSTSQWWHGFSSMTQLQYYDMFCYTWKMFPYRCLKKLWPFTLKFRKYLWHGIPYVKYQNILIILCQCKKLGKIFTGLSTWCLWTLR